MSRDQVTTCDTCKQACTDGRQTWELPEGFQKDVCERCITPQMACEIALDELASNYLGSSEGADACRKALERMRGGK